MPRRSRRLPTLGGPYFAPTAINNGDVTGFGQTSTFAQHGFLYSNGTLTDLGNNFFMYAINDSDVMVGNDLIVSNGTVQNINNLIPAGSPEINYAVGINDNGQISARTNGILLPPTDDVFTVPPGARGDTPGTGEPSPARCRVRTPATPRPCSGGLWWTRVDPDILLKTDGRVVALFAAVLAG